jgi:predicted NUDIX family NTP pyrophosphohydrolase
LAATKPSTKLSAGLLMYRGRGRALEVFLAHPGGPFFLRRDLGAWTVPKGEVASDEDPRAAARREFHEEIGLGANEPWIDLGEVRQKGGKRVRAWAFEGDAPCGFAPRSNSFEVEWPPRSGHRRSFPEIDRAEFFDLQTARAKINEAQVRFLERLAIALETARGD